MRETRNLIEGGNNLEKLGQIFAYTLNKFNKDRESIMISILHDGL